MSARPAARRALFVGLVTLACGAPAPATSAGDRDLAGAHRTLYPAAENAALRAAGPEAVQAAYDAARDLQERLRSSGPVTAPCRPLLVGLARYAAGRVRQMEGVDRPAPADVAAGRRLAGRARAAVARAAPRCRGRGGGRPAPPLAMSPAGGEAFFGAIVARAPRGADRAELVVDGRPVTTVAVRSGRARFTLREAPGRRDLLVRFERAGRPAGATQARGAWLLGPSALRAEPGSRASAPLAEALARATARGPRHRAAWVQDLATGEAAGVAAGAAFPAASLVKLGLMAGAIGRLGGSPARSAYAHDLRAVAAWSSNLAANRLLRRLGGEATARDGLRRLGAGSSTFPGEYIVGTELQPALPGASSAGAPPAVSRRVTTARDMARMLYAIQAAAVGAGGARAETGLTAHQARLMLGWLLASQQRGGNVSMLAGGAPALPIAQKNGWIRSARHGAGIIYTDRGPAIAVMLTYDPAGVGAAEGRALGARIAAVALR